MRALNRLSLELVELSRPTDTGDVNGAASAHAGWDDNALEDMPRVSSQSARLRAPPPSSIRTPSVSEKSIGEAHHLISAQLSQT